MKINSNLRNSIYLTTSFYLFAYIVCSRCQLNIFFELPDVINSWASGLNFISTHLHSQDSVRNSCITFSIFNTINNSCFSSIQTYCVWYNEWSSDSLIADWKRWTTVFRNHAPCSNVTISKTKLVYLLLPWAERRNLHLSTVF